jgi:hypothetical protein
MFAIHKNKILVDRIRLFSAKADKIFFLLHRHKNTLQNQNRNVIKFKRDRMFGACFQNRDTHIMAYINLHV